MLMLVSEHGVTLPGIERHDSLLMRLKEILPKVLATGFLPLRFVITNSTDREYECEVGGISGVDWPRGTQLGSIFEFVRRRIENTAQFTTVLLVPTGEFKD